MFNSNDLRAQRARRAEMERAARKHNTARAAQKPQTPQKVWSRFAALFL
jgi:hypothetical protein